MTDMFGARSANLLVLGIAETTVHFGPKIGAAVARTSWRDIRPFYRAWRTARDHRNIRHADCVRGRLKAVLWNGGSQSGGVAS